MIQFNTKMYIIMSQKYWLFYDIKNYNYCGLIFNLFKTIAYYIIKNILLQVFMLRVLSEQC